MNESFNIQRFGALFVRYWAERKLVNGLYWLLVIALLFWFFNYIQESLSTHEYETDGIETPLLFIYFPLTIVIQMMLVFKELSNRKTAASLILIPASKFEKFLFLLICGLIVPTLLFFGAIFSIDSIVLHFVYPESHKLFLDQTFSGHDYYYIIYGFAIAIFACLIIFLGYFALRKNHLLYSLLFLFVGGYWGLNSLNEVLIRYFVHPRLYGGTSLGQISSDYSMYYTVYDEGLLYHFPHYSLPVLVFLAAGLIYSTYLKFSEKQIKI